MKQLFETLLGISSNANSEEIKRAYYQKALQYHPDRNRDKEGGRNEEEMKRINEAYEILMDQEKRREWEAKHPEDSDVLDAPSLPPSSNERASLSFARCFQKMKLFFLLNPEKPISSKKREAAYNCLQQEDILLPYYQHLYRKKQNLQEN